MPSPKLKRWKNFIAEYGAELKYKPGSQNTVADALSRQQINSNTLDTTVHSMDSSPIEKIKRVALPLNRYKIQFEIQKPISIQSSLKRFSLIIKGIKSNIHWKRN